MSEIINVKVPVIQFSFVNRNRMKYSIDALVTYNDIKCFLESRSISNYTIEISVGSVRILIKKLFFNVKQLQMEIDQVRPLAIQIVCRKYNLKEWLMNTSLMKKLKSIFIEIRNGRS